MDEEGLDAGRARGGARARAGARVPLHDPDLPEPERPHALDRAAPPDRRARAGARPARARGRPVRARPLRGRAASRRCSSSTAASASSTPRRSRRPSRPGSASATSILPAALARRARGDVDVHLHHARPSRRRRPSTSSSAAATSSRISSGFAGCSRARRDAMLEALDAELGGRARPGRRPEGGYFVWLDLPGASTTRACSAAADGRASRSCRAPTSGGVGRRRSRRRGSPTASSRRTRSARASGD